MTTNEEKQFGNQNTKEYDALIIGAGVSGMYQLYRLRELGMSVLVIEAGSGVGGTWYWNRYPGARFDSESYSYGYSFSDELLQEWNWSEHFAAQPETLRYLNYVADKFDLRRDIVFHKRVTNAAYDENANRWEITTDDGDSIRGRLLITAIGPLSAPQYPAFDGMDTFAGESYHTGLWPHEPVNFKGKRVGVVGTGASGVQVIQTIANEVDHLTVFQRRPNYCAPLQNTPITAEEMDEIKANYPAIFAQCRDSFASFLVSPDPRSALEVSAQEREAFFEKLYAEPGFGIWLGNFGDVFTDQRANDLITEFICKKIRGRVDDPAIAEKLIPTDHGFGLRRVPLESGYYEIYNQDNVTLVDCLEQPIDCVTPSGIRRGDTEYPLDMIIYATGFNAVIGAFDKIEFRGVGNRILKDKWIDGPRTNLGIQTAGFPNLLTLVGPHNAATFCNIPRCIEQNVEWVTELISHMQDHNYERVETTIEAEDEWTRHVYETAKATLFTTVDSWFMNVNANLPEKKRTFMAYAGGSAQYREKCDDVAARNYAGFVFN
ncbi:MAG: flavin-containing monooxygenase [Gammaproteobacteria bacterium]